MRMRAGTDQVKAQRLEAVLPIEGYVACVVLRNPEPDDIMQMRTRMVHSCRHELWHSATVNEPAIARS
jgi:hypothetical protein